MSLRFINTWLVCLVLSLSAVTQVASAQDVALKRRSDILYGRLDNGLTYYIWPNTTPRHEAVYRLFIQSGSLNEDDDQQGLAHFLEHMAFNGSRHFPGGAMVHFLESHGAKFGKDLNAHTAFDETVYKLQLPTHDPAFVDSALMVMADWAYGLTIDPEEVAKERGVILSEWRTKQRGNTSTLQSMLDELFVGSRYAERHTIGDTAIINHATRDVLMRYYRQWYRPELMAVAVVGDVDVAQVEQTIRRLFGEQWPAQSAASLPGQRTQYLIPPYRKAAARVVTAAEEKDISLEGYLRLPPAQPVLTEGDIDGYTLRLLTGRLIKQRLAHFSFTDSTYLKASMALGSLVRGGNVWMTGVSLSASTVVEGIQTFVARQQQILRYGFTQKEINTVSRQLLQQKKRALRYPLDVTSDKRMEELYNDFMRKACCISDSDEYRLLASAVSRIDSLTIVRYLQTFDQPDRTHYLLRGNPELLRQVPDGKHLLRVLKKARKQRVQPYTDQREEIGELCKPEDNGGVSHIIATDSLPDVDALRWKLDNGSEVIYRYQADERHRLVLTGFRSAGLYHLDSLDFHNGLYAGAIVPISGAGSFSREGLASFTQGTSASMSMLIDKNRTGISGSARTDDIPLLFRLLYTKWTAPRLDEDATSRVLGQIRQTILTRQPSARDDFRRRCSRLLEAENYVNRQQTLQDLDSLVSTDRMLPLWHRLFGSAHGYHFILTGDYPTDSLRQLVDTWIGALPDEPQTFKQVYEPRYPLQSDTMLVLDGKGPKTTVTLTWQAQDFPLQTAPISLQNDHLLGDAIKGVASSHLRALLREELSMTYSVAVTVGSTLHPAPLWRTSVAFSCQPQNADTLVMLTRQVLQQLADDPQLMASTLDDVKQNLLKQHDIDVQRGTWWVGYIRNLIYNDERDWSFAHNYQQAVAELTPQRLSDVLKVMLKMPCAQTRQTIDN